MRREIDLMFLISNWSPTLGHCTHGQLLIVSVELNCTVFWNTKLLKTVAALKSFKVQFTIECVWICERWKVRLKIFLWEFYCRFKRL